MVSRRQDPLSEMRRRSRQAAASLGYPEPPDNFPLLDQGMRPRSGAEVVARIAALSAIGAVAHGCPASVAHAWLDGEGLLSALADSERGYLGRSEHSASDEEAGRPEAVFTLAWATSLVPESLDFDRVAPESLIHAVPHPPPAPQGTDAAVAKGRLRSTSELTQALDLAYCLHWAIEDSALRGASLESPLPAWVVVERRRALEWLLSAEDWDDVSLDT